MGAARVVISVFLQRSCPVDTPVMRSLWKILLILGRVLSGSVTSIPSCNTIALSSRWLFLNPIRGVSHETFWVSLGRLHRFFSGSYRPG